MKTDKHQIAQDSARSYDKDGRLYVAQSNISKAAVNPYYGKEIPLSKELGLQPEKIYYLLRAPDELEKAAPTFRNLPLLSEHTPVSADEPRKDIVVGSTGSDVEFVDGFLRCSLSVWDASAIAGIESEQQMELSGAYHYRADMTAGEFDGTRYDGVMRDIVGNHVALVDVGRAGRDVVVADQDPFINRNFQKGNNMKLKQGAQARVKQKLQAVLAQDADLTAEELLEVVGALTQEVETPAAQDENGQPENPPEPPAQDGDNDDDENPDNPPPAQDDDDDDEAKNAALPAMDAATVKREIAKAVAAERQRNQAANQARRDVAHLVGDVAMDSADDIYKFALEQHGVETKGVHPGAYRSMVAMLGKSHITPIAADKAPDLSAQFPNLKNIRKG